MIDVMRKSITDLAGKPNPDSQNESFHLLYTLNGTFHSEFRDFPCFADAEQWLKSIGADRWEIG